MGYDTVYVAEQFVTEDAPTDIAVKYTCAGCGKTESVDRKVHAEFREEQNLPGGWHTVTVSLLCRYMDSKGNLDDSANYPVCSDDCVEKAAKRAVDDMLEKHKSRKVEEVGYETEERVEDG